MEVMSAGEADPSHEPVDADSCLNGQDLEMYSPNADLVIKFNHNKIFCKSISDYV